MWGFVVKIFTGIKGYLIAAGAFVLAIGGAFLMGWMKRGEHNAGKQARDSLKHVKDYKDVQDDIDRMSAESRRRELRDWSD